jgi:hypothetical protein|tara:strand:- start:371 stop:577 length:207 start_codon:yes stop_codon:yes gene_type:complete
MSYLSTLKKAEINSSERWIVKYYDNRGHKIREIKQVYDPSDYRKNGRARELHTKDQLISILENYKNNV